VLGTVVCREWCIMACWLVLSAGWSCPPEEAVCLGVKLVEGMHVSEPSFSEPAHTKDAAAQRVLISTHMYAA
jgi:hypothetical protein